MTSLHRSSRLAPLLACALVSVLGAVSAGCDSPVTPPHDGGTDAATSPRDGSVPCTVDGDCDDHLSCTNDRCLPGFLTCEHTADHGRCDDGIFCNGPEFCDFRLGCEHVVTHESCDDNDVCTLDRCVEATKTCEHRPRDLDEDGDPDFFCEHGTDCDDRDPTRSGVAPEICDDTIDNDCDGTTDEGSGLDGGGADGGDGGSADGGMPLCGRPAHDTCGDPFPITGSGTMDLRVGGASADYRLNCSFSAHPDVVATLTLTEPHDVRITAEGDLATAQVALRTTCVDATTEIECDDGYPGEIRHRALAAGTYYLIVQGTGDVLLDVQLTDPTPPPTNETCAAPTLIPPTGGRYTGSFVDGHDDVTLSCSGIPASDLVYQIDLPTESNLTVTLSSPDNQYMYWDVRPTCDATAGSVRCRGGAPADGTMHQLPAGTYFILIEGPSYVEADFSLSVDVGPSTPRVTGDLCATPIPLTVGTRYTGTMSGAEDDIVTACGYNYRELVHSFTIPALSDVTIDVDGGLSYLNASLRTTCDNAGTQVRCPTGAPISSHLRALAAGTYYLIVEGARGGSYTIDITATTPPTVPTPATGNDSCGGPVIIPPTGGFWSGTTMGMANDYDPLICGTGTPAPDVAFRLDLATRSRITATTEGSAFDTLLYRFMGTCRTGMEARCDDDGGSAGTSQLTETLDPGTYFYVVDGFSSTAMGNYEFQVFITPVP